MDSVLLSGGGRVVRHVDSFVRSTRHRGRGERSDEPIDVCEWACSVICAFGQDGPVGRVYERVELRPGCGCTSG